MERRVAELHVVNARERAMRLFTLTSTIFPEEWKTSINEMLTVDLAEFALHARRVTELCELRNDQFPSVSVSRYVYKEVSSEPLESNYHEALNRIVHARSYTVGHGVWDGPKVYTESKQNLTIAYVKIATDRKTISSVSVFGVAFCFLTEVVSRIKTKHPELRF